MESKSTFVHGNRGKLPIFAGRKTTRPSLFLRRGLQIPTKMKRFLSLFILCLALSAQSSSAKDIRVVEISTGSNMNGSYDSSIQSILKTLSGVSKVVSDVSNLILTITYDADQVGVDDIVSHINKQEPRFEAKQKSDPKTKKMVKEEKKRDEADRKIEQEKEKMNLRDQERDQKQGAKNSPVSEPQKNGSNEKDGGMKR